MSRHYLDHAANSPLRNSAAQAWMAATEVVGNPASLHGSARAARSILEDARESIAEDLGAHPTEVIFTSGGSEADTLAVLGTMLARPDRPALVIGGGEHPAVATAATRFDDVRVMKLQADGRVSLKHAAELIDDQVALVSVQTINNEVGTRQPVDEIAELAHRNEASIHTDAVQALVWPGIDFAKTQADLVSLSAHKIGGPVGIGVLLARRDAKLTAAGLGGGQERELRSGTQAIALAASFAAALRETVAERDAAMPRLRELRSRLLAGALAVEGAVLNGPADPEWASPAIVNLTFTGIRADDVLLILDREGIDASVGSACRAGVHQPSEVILAMGRSLEEATSTLRFSFGHTTTEDDIDALLAVLPSAVESARAAFQHSR